MKAFFDSLATDGDAYVNFSWTNCRGERISSQLAVTFDSVFLRSDLQQPAPKYDPCRLFRVGDIVTPIERDGREVPDGAPVGEKCTVVEPEKNGIVCIRYDVGSEYYIHEIPFYHLELVSPVEELKPYRVEESTDYFSVDKGEEEICLFWKDKHPNPKAAAEAECSLLNEGYRKDQNNGNQ